MNSISSISLLPYLDCTQSRIYLKICQLSQESSQSIKRDVYPFWVVSDSDPLSLMVQGELKTDSGCTVKKLFLLFQRDKYNFLKDGFWPLTNRELDRL